MLEMKIAWWESRKVAGCFSKNAFAALPVSISNETTTSRDTITVTPHGPGGSTVHYRAEFTFTGVARLAGPLMKPLLDRLGDRTAEQLKSALDRL